MGPVTPGRLRPGDTVAIVRPSWGGPSRFPGIYEQGLAVLRDELGLQVREMPHARSDADWLAAHPEARAADLEAALRDPEVRAIWCSIGGDDSIRLLPRLDASVPAAHPKVLVGYSESTTLLVWMRRNGVVAYHGPSVMAGIAQWRALPPEFGQQLRAVLFGGGSPPGLRPFRSYSEGYPDWAKSESLGATHPTQPGRPWAWLNGPPGPFEGELFGGCHEVLHSMHGTPYFPPPEFFEGKLLVLETSEEVPPPRTVARTLRTYGVAGILDRISGILLGRPRGYSDEARADLATRDHSAVTDEFGRSELPVVSELDFGHTDPQWVLPIGVRARVDPVGPTLTFLEPTVA
ncbi:MAG: LD-carboxypeptidase [Thermoplasmata archaeon]|nr:LD-carboxypeptidase [Thermoplasmata archaeon]